MIESVLLSWFLTVSIEALLLWIILKNRPWQVLIFSILINSLTLPLAIYMYQYLITNLILVELLVVILEGFLLKVLFLLPYKKAFIISLAVNIVTALVGILISII
jgi:hypothetical protein